MLLLADAEMLARYGVVIIGATMIAYADIDAMLYKTYATLISFDFIER